MRIYILTGLLFLFAVNFISCQYCYLDINGSDSIITLSAVGSCLENESTDQIVIQINGITGSASSGLLYSSDGLGKTNSISKILAPGFYSQVQAEVWSDKSDTVYSAGPYSFTVINKPSQPTLDILTWDGINMTVEGTCSVPSYAAGLLLNIYYVRDETYTQIGTYNLDAGATSYSYTFEPITEQLTELAPGTYDIVVQYGLSYSPVSGEYNCWSDYSKSKSIYLDFPETTITSLVTNYSPLKNSITVNGYGFADSSSFINIYDGTKLLNSKPALVEPNGDYTVSSGIALTSGSHAIKVVQFKADLDSQIDQAKDQLNNSLDNSFEDQGQIYNQAYNQHANNLDNKFNKSLKDKREDQVYNQLNNRAKNKLNNSFENQCQIYNQTKNQLDNKLNNSLKDKCENQLNNRDNNRSEIKSLSELQLSNSAEWDMPPAPVILTAIADANGLITVSGTAPTNGYVKLFASGRAISDYIPVSSNFRNISSNVALTYGIYDLCAIFSLVVNNDTIADSVFSNSVYVSSLKPSPVISSIAFNHDSSITIKGVSDNLDEPVSIYINSIKVRTIKVDNSGLFEFNTKTLMPENYTIEVQSTNSALSKPYEVIIRAS